MKVIIAAMLMVSVVCGVFADVVPPLVNYQGEVKDDSGTPLATGFYDVDFRLYNTASAAEGGTLLWSRRYNLYVMNGMFNAILGQGGIDVPGDSPASADLMNVFKSYNGDQGDPRYLSLAVDGGAEFTPRQRLLSAPYAVRAATAGYADGTLNATNATNAKRAENADYADNAGQATHASSANQATNALLLGNHPASFYARQDQMAQAPTGNWQAQFWDGTSFHNGPMYWQDPTIGIGGQPGVDGNVGLRMVNGSLRPKSGDGWNTGIIFQENSSSTAYRMFQTTSGSEQELYLKTDGAGDANVTINANKGVMVRGDQTVTLSADTQINMQTPLINSSALKEGCRIVWPNFSATRGEWKSFTAEGDGILILNAKQMMWDIEVPDHMDGDYTGTARRQFQVRFAKNNVDDTTGHSFVWPLKKGTVIRSRLADQWSGFFWYVWVIYFN